MTEESSAEHSATPSTKRSRKAWIWGGGVAAVLVIAMIVAALSGVFASQDPEPAPVATPTEEVTPDPTATPEPEPEEEPLGPPVIDIPSVQHMAYTPVWNPPDEGQYFWQIVDPEHGYPEDGGTDYLLAHACETRECAGDELRRLSVGDTLTYLGDTYVVEDKQEIMKVDIGEQDIWEHDPNRIVIITCIIETTWDASDKNDIIIATRVNA